MALEYRSFEKLAVAQGYRLKLLMKKSIMPVSMPSNKFCIPKTLI